MQLASVMAQPPVPTRDAPNPFLRIFTTLRGEQPPAASAAASMAAAAPPAADIEQAQPSLGAKLLGGVAETQNRYLANQQLLGVISAGLGARFSMIAKNVWSMLRGTDQQEQAPQLPPQPQVTDTASTTPTTRTTPTTSAPPAG